VSAPTREIKGRKNDVCQFFILMAASPAWVNYTDFQQRSTQRIQNNESDKKESHT